jgi:hypothetical protein
MGQCILHFFIKFKNVIMQFPHLFDFRISAIGIGLSIIQQHKFLRKGEFMITYLKQKSKTF